MRLLSGRTIDVGGSAAGNQIQTQATPTLTVLCPAISADVALTEEFGPHPRNTQGDRVTIHNVSRRKFMATSGALVLGAAFPVKASRPDASIKTVLAPNLYVALDTKGTVTITSHRSEMGQGIRTAIAKSSPTRWRLIGATSWWPKLKAIRPMAIKIPTDHKASGYSWISSDEQARLPSHARNSRS
ncbi:MAG: hypothetical protein Ct9H300mP8_07800 [Gammaproteobacteria bacterium]|nr:MAG: hypothetical protein Ct9H300mP8_07800 [Gammaproteobacteria bacterium]